MKKHQTVSRVVLIVAHDPEPRLNATGSPVSTVDLVTEYLYAGTDYAHDLHVLSAHETPMIVVPERTWNAISEKAARQ